MTVLPHIGRTITSTVVAINTGLQSLKEGGRTLGKVAVIVDPDLAERTWDSRETAVSDN